MCADSDSKITSVSPQVRDPNRCSIFVDGEFAFGVHSDLVLEYALAPGQPMTEELQERLEAADAVIRAKQKALNLLAYRPRTERELRDRLEQAGFEHDAVERAVSRIRELGYIDDEAFAREFVRQQAGTKGPRRLRAELRRKGVAHSLIEDALHEALASRDAAADALAQAERKWSRLQHEPDARKRRNRLYAFLARRGFEPMVIHQVIETLERRAP